MSENENEKSFVPYDQTHRLRQLLFVTTIVSAGQEEYITQLNTANEAALCCMCYGKGTVSAELASILALPLKKSVVFSVLRADRWPSYRDALTERFSISKMSKGIAYAIPLDSVAGISIYKMLSNTRMFEKPTKLTAKKKGREDK